ncbi:MAG: diguanylate cyclase [Desulfuromonadales bacterium]
MKAADLPSTTPPTQRFRSLRNKLFLPFILLILLVCVAAVWGSMQLLEMAVKQSTDERLAAAREVLYREFKKQEILLQHYAVIVQQFQTLTEQAPGDDQLDRPQRKLLETLKDANISAAYYPVDDHGPGARHSLTLLFDQVRRSGRARFGYLEESDGGPVLAVAAPVLLNGQLAKIILLKSSLGDTFLRNATATLNISATLMSMNGQVIARSRPDSAELKLTPEQFQRVGQGQPLFIDHTGDSGLERYLFTMIPFGSSDRALLSLQTFLQKSIDAQSETLQGMILVMIALVVLGTFIYFRKLSTITQTAGELRNAAHTIARGNLNYRIHDIPNDELGQVAASFNQMAIELEKTYHERASRDIAAALAQQENETKTVLEKQERERSKLNAEMGIMQREASALYQLNHAMIAAIDLEAYFDRMLQMVNEGLEFDLLVLLVYNPGESTLEVARTAGLRAESLQDLHFTLNQGITGEAAQNQRMIYLKNVEQDRDKLSGYRHLVTRGSMVSVPLVVKSRLVGVLNMHKKQPDAFSPAERKMIQAVANQTAIAIDHAQLYERSREQSNTDELTGVASRRHFQEILKREVAQARRFTTVFSILMCDIDGFKEHKSAIGDILADALLRLVARSLLKNTRGIDLVGRFGNDQFILLLPKTDKNGAFTAAEKLRKSLGTEDFSRDLHTELELKITLSFGVTEFPSDSQNIYELLNLADRALYAAKQNGCNCTVSWEGSATLSD